MMLVVMVYRCKCIAPTQLSPLRAGRCVSSEVVKLWKWWSDEMMKWWHQTNTTHYSLLTTHCSLLTAHCSLLTAHCSLPRSRSDPDLIHIWSRSDPDLIQIWSDPDLILILSNPDIDPIWFKQTEIQSNDGVGARWRVEFRNVIRCRRIRRKLTRKTKTPTAF